MHDRSGECESEASTPATRTCRDWPALARYSSTDAPLERALSNWDVAGAYDVVHSSAVQIGSSLEGDILIAGAVAWRTSPAAAEELAKRAALGDAEAVEAVRQWVAASETPPTSMDFRSILAGVDPLGDACDWLDRRRSGIADGAPWPEGIEKPPAVWVLEATQSDLPRLRAVLERQLGRHTPAFTRYMAEALERLGEPKAAAAQLRVLVDQEPPGAMAKEHRLRAWVHMARLYGNAGERKEASRALWDALRLGRSVEDPEIRALWLEQVAYTALVLAQPRVGTVAYLAAAEAHGELRGKSDVRRAVAMVRAGDLLLQLGKLATGVRILHRTSSELGLDILYQPTGAEALSYWLQGMFRLGRWDEALEELDRFLQQKAERRLPIWPGYFAHTLNSIAPVVSPLEFARLLREFALYVERFGSALSEDLSPLTRSITQHCEPHLFGSTTTHDNQVKILLAESLLGASRLDNDEEIRTRFVRLAVNEAQRLVGDAAKTVSHFELISRWLRIALTAAQPEAAPFNQSFGSTAIAEVRISSPGVEVVMESAGNGRLPVARPPQRASLRAQLRTTRIFLMPVWRTLPAPVRIVGKRIIINLASQLMFKSEK